MEHTNTQMFQTNLKKQLSLSLSLFVKLEPHCDRHGLQLLQEEAEGVRCVHLRDAPLLRAVLTYGGAIAHDGVLRWWLRGKSTRTAHGQRRRIRVVEKTVQDHLRGAV